MKYALVRDSIVENIILWGEGQPPTEIDGAVVHPYQDGMYMGQWVGGAAPVSLATLSTLRDRVNVERDRRIDALVVVHNGVPYDVDHRSRANMMGVLSLDVPDTITWRGADNITRQIPRDEFVAAAQAITAAIYQIYAASWNLKDVTAPALTEADARSFDVSNSALWP